MNNKKLNRRNFLKIAALSSLTMVGCLSQDSKFATAAGSPLKTMTTAPTVGKGNIPTAAKPATAFPAASKTASSLAAAAEPTRAVYLPEVTNAGASPVVLPTTPRVVHIYDSRVTSWAPGSRYDYWNTVQQPIVNGMVDAGLKTLTGAGTTADAWRALLPKYSPGQIIAIKVSFNNSNIYTLQQLCNPTSSYGGAIDGLIQPVNALVTGMMSIGVRAQDIVVYDAMRGLPNYFVNGGISGVVFRDSGTCTSNPAGFSNKNLIAFSNTDIAADTEQITSTLVDATYLINMPIPKLHFIGGVSVGYKNHFGSIHNPNAIHKYIEVAGTSYRRNYNPLVDIYANPNVGPKTILTVGDAIFCAQKLNAAPVAWSNFGNAVPKSLFFSRDPVAADCVMIDWLRAEWPDPTNDDKWYDYLRLASAANQGAFEKADPRVAGSYKTIDYKRTNLG